MTMITNTGRLIVALLVLRSPQSHRTIAFQQSNAVPAAPSRSSARRGDVGVSAARRDEADSGPEDDDVFLSRRDALLRATRGAGLALAASATGIDRGNALDLPNFFESDRDRAIKGMPAMPVPSVPNNKAGGLANKIRSVGNVMDELQRDVMQERWDLLDGYSNQLRSYVAVFTAYTDAAFPTDIETDKGLRVALRYEVGRFFGSLFRFSQAAGRRTLDEAFVAYSDMSLHYDRYLRLGGLYTTSADAVSLETYYQGIPDSALVYVDPKKDPAEVRDLVLLVKGPDKGKTGIVIGIYRDGSDTCAVKLDRIRGMREIRVVSTSWAGKRMGEQDPDDVFLIPRSGCTPDNMGEEDPEDIFMIPRSD